MYYYLKNNCFYLEQIDNTLFLKNNFCSVSIKNKGAYKLFKMMLPAFEGNVDVDKELEKLENQKVKKFLKSLLEILKDNKFVLYSDEIININAYSDEEQNILFCYGGNIHKKNNNLNEQYVVYCPDKKIGKIICNILNCSRINVSLVNDVGNYICVNGKQKLIIYKKNNKVIVSSVLVQPSDIDKDLFKLPYNCRFS